MSPFSPAGALVRLISTYVPIAESSSSVLKILLLQQQEKNQRRYYPFFSLRSASSVAIAFVMTIIVSLNMEFNGASVLAAAVKVTGFSESGCKTISVKVGMRNSEIAAALPHAHFGRVLQNPAQYIRRGITARGMEKKKLLKRFKETVLV